MIEQVQAWLWNTDPYYMRIIIDAPTYSEAHNWVLYDLKRNIHPLPRVTVSLNYNPFQTLRGLHEKHMLIIRYRTEGLSNNHLEALGYLHSADVLDVT